MTLKVNGEVIPPEAIEFELNRLVKFYSQHMPPERVRSRMDDLRARAREQAIGAKLLLVESQRLDIQVSPADVDGRMEKIIGQSGGDGKFREMLKKRGMTVEQVRAGIEKGRRVDLLISRVTDEVPEPTEEEMEAYFKEHSQDFTREEMAQVQHILIRPATDAAADRATARSRLEEIRCRVGEGAEFSTEAAAHSECPSGKKTGGSLGWLSRGAMVPEVDRVIFSMEDGQVSDIVETSLGMHIFKRLAHEKSGPASYTDVSGKIRELIRHARRGQAISAYVEELKKKAVIEDD